MRDKGLTVVGIGASAGGLKAVSLLLSHLRADTGMAFVVISHMDRRHVSLLSDLLQKTTAMIVAATTDGAPIEPDHVYLILPNTHMYVNGRNLKLVPRPQSPLAFSIDCFFNSLAKEYGKKAIAVVLSGTGSDGALGIEAIKSEGGLVFAQDQESADQAGMPQSADATGMVDFILPPEKIAAKLNSIALDLQS